MEKWLLTPLKSTHSRLTFSLVVIAMCYLWLAFITPILTLFGFTSGNHSFPDDLPMYLFTACLIAPLWEELVFRIGPISLARKITPEHIILVAVVSSILFGRAHRNGVLSLLWQGVTGFGFAVIYIKTGFRHWYNIAAHSVWNLLVLLP